MASREKKVVANKKELDSKPLKTTPGKQDGIVRKLGRPPKCRDLQGNIVRVKKSIWKRKPRLGLPLGRPRSVAKPVVQEGRDLLGGNTSQLVSPSQGVGGSDAQDIINSESGLQSTGASDSVVKPRTVTVKRRFKKLLTTATDLSPKPKKIRAKLKNCEGLESVQVNVPSLAPPKKLGRPSLKVKRGINAGTLTTTSLEVRNGTKLKAHPSPYTTRSGVPSQLLRNGKRRKFKEPVGTVSLQGPKTKKRRRLLSSTTEGSNVDSLNESFTEEQTASRIGSESDSSVLDSYQMENGTWDSDVEMKPSEALGKDGVDPDLRPHINGEPSKDKDNTSENSVPNHVGKPAESKSDLIKKSRSIRDGDDGSDDVFDVKTTVTTGSSRKTDSNSNLCDVNNPVKASKTENVSLSNVNVVGSKVNKVVTKRLVSCKNEDRPAFSDTTAGQALGVSAEGPSKHLEVVSLNIDRLERGGSPNSISTCTDRAITPSDNWDTMSVMSTPSSKNFDASFDDISEKDTDCENGKEIRRSQRSSIRKSRAALLRLATRRKRSGKNDKQDRDSAGDGQLPDGGVFISPAQDDIGLIMKDIIQREEINNELESKLESSSLGGSKEDLDKLNADKDSLNITKAVESVVEKATGMVACNVEQSRKQNLIKKKGLKSIERRRRVKSLNTQDIVHLVQHDLCAVKERRASDFGLGRGDAKDAKGGNLADQKLTAKKPRKYKLKRSLDGNIIEKTLKNKKGLGPGRRAIKIEGANDVTDKSVIKKIGQGKETALPGRPRKYKLKRLSDGNVLDSPLIKNIKSESPKTKKTTNVAGIEEPKMRVSPLLSKKSSTDVVKAPGIGQVKTKKAFPRIISSAHVDEEVMVIEAKVSKNNEADDSLLKVDTKEETKTFDNVTKVSKPMGILQDEDMAEKLRELSKKIECEPDMFPSLYVKPLIPLSLKLEPNDNNAGIKKETKVKTLDTNIADNKSMPVLKKEAKFGTLEAEANLKQDNLKINDEPPCMEKMEIVEEPSKLPILAPISADVCTLPLIKPPESIVRKDIVKPETNGKPVVVKSIGGLHKQTEVVSVTETSPKLPNKNGEKEPCTENKEVEGKKGFNIKTAGVILAPDKKETKVEKEQPHMENEQMVVNEQSAVEKSQLPIDKNECSAVEKETPAGEKKTPVVEKKTPAGERKTPLVEKKTPAGEKKTPLVEKKTPAVEKKTPAVEKKIPAVEKKTPAVEKKTPAVEKKTPAVEKETLAVEKKTLAVEKKTPAVEKETSAVQKEAPAVEKETPAVGKEKPAVEKETPAVEKETPAVEKETPAVEKETPAVGKEKPAVEKETPAVEKETSAVEKETSAVKKETPAVEKEIPAVEKEILAVEKEIPAVEKEKPAVEKEKSAVEKEKPAVEKEKPAFEQEKPAVEKEKPAVEKEMPAVEKEVPATEKDKLTVGKEQAIAEKELSTIKKENSELQRRPSTVEKKQTVIEKKQEIEEKSAVVERKQSTEKKQSAPEKKQSEKKIQKAEKRRSTVDKEPLTVDKQQPLVTTEQSIVNKEQTIVEAEQSALDHEQLAVAAKLSVEVKVPESSLPFEKELKVDGNKDIVEISNISAEVKLPKLVEDATKNTISASEKRSVDLVSKHEEETPEDMAVKESILSALGLLSLEAAKAAKIAKKSAALPHAGQDSSYTGTLKTIIKVQRSPEKRTRPLKMTLKNNKPSKHDDSEVNGLHYSICKEAGAWNDEAGTSSSAGIGNRKCLKPSFSYRSYFDISSNPQLFVEDTVPAESGDHDSGKEGEKKQLVIPEKASSFSIHPGRLCSDVCSYCFGKFGSLDTPCHVAQLKGSERQVKILQAELHLTADSCLCDACFRHVDRKANCPTYREKTKGKKHLHHMSRAARPKATCCVLGCVQTAQHHVRRKWLTKLKRNIGKKVPVINNKLPPHVPVPLCSQHYARVNHFMICGICRRRLNCNQMYLLGPEVHEINTILATDRIPVTLVEKVFLCKMCRCFTSLRTKCVDKTKLTGNNKIFYENHRKKILQFLDVEVTEEPEPEAPKRKRRKIKVSSKTEVNGESAAALPEEKKQDEVVSVINLTSSEDSSPPSVDISSMVETQLVEPMIDYSTLGSDAPNVVVPSGSKASMPPGNYRVEPVKPTKIRLTFGNSKPGPSNDKKSNNVVLLGQEPEMPTFSSVLETPQLSVTANFDFRNPITVKADSEGDWEKCAFSLQYDRDSKQAFEKLKRPYGSQSSFFRHLLLLEQYWRSGELMAAPNSNARTKSYLKSVQNRINSFSMSVPSTSCTPIAPKVQSAPPSSVAIIDLPLRRLSGGIMTTASSPRPPTFSNANAGSLPSTSSGNPMFLSQLSPTKKYVINPVTGQYITSKRKPNIVQVTKGGQPLFRLVDPTKSQIRALQGYKRKAPTTVPAPTTTATATVTSDNNECVPLICDVRSLGEEGTKLWNTKPKCSVSVAPTISTQPPKPKVAISILPKPPVVGPKPNTVLTPTGIILSKKLDISVSPIVKEDPGKS